MAQATILQGDAEAPVRYVEVPRKAENAETWLLQQMPAVANGEPVDGKVN